MGGILAAQNDRGRKDWAAPFHYLSRKLDGHGYGSLPATPAGRDRSPRRWLHQHHAWIAAGYREKPGLSHGGAEQSTPGKVKTAAVDWRGFRTRDGDAIG